MVEERADKYMNEERADRNPNPVWIIDDDRSIRWVFEKALAREGIGHRTFATAQEALDRLAEESPQVVVSDIRMPGLSGLEFMQALKERLPSTPVIIMTAYSDLESAVAAFQGGAFEYLPKPFDVDHAVELVRRALEESRRRVEAPPDGRRDARRSSGRPRRCRRSSAPSAGFRSRTPRCSSPASRARARSSWRARCIATARARPRPSSPSTRPRSPRTSSKASSSATSAAPSPARRRCAAAASSRPRAARSSSTRSATCRRTCRRGSCACSPTGSSTASAATRRSPPTCA